MIRWNWLHRGGAIAARAAEVPPRPVAVGGAEVKGETGPSARPIITPPILAPSHRIPAPQGEAATALRRSSTRQPRRLKTLAATSEPPDNRVTLSAPVFPQGMRKRSSGNSKILKKAKINLLPSHSPFRTTGETGLAFHSTGKERSYREWRNPLQPV